MYTVKKVAGEGSRSLFYKLNQRGKGFKTFLDRHDAEYARDVQLELSRLDLAPRVYSEVGRIRIGDRLSRWGYVTEVAKVITPHRTSCNCYRCDNLENEYEEEIGELQERIERAGYYFGDAHTGNVGYITRNCKKIMVCIDTGEESVQPYESDGDYDAYSCNCNECRKYREEQYA
jgi:hypothetical protein